VPALAARGITVTFAAHTEGLSTTALCQRIREEAGPLTVDPATPGPSRTGGANASQASSATRRVLALGVFDLLHEGHVRYLQRARQLGDQLIVGVAPDALCLAGKQRLPVIPEAQRRELIQGLAGVDEVHTVPVSMAETQAAAAWIRSLPIDTLACGQEWQGTPRFERLEAALAKAGIDVVYLPSTAGISSSEIRRWVQAG